MQRFPPLSSARNSSVNRPRAWFDSGLEFAIKEEAKLREPGDGSVWRHIVGLSGEFALSGYFQEPINREIYDDFEGDDGYDIVASIAHGEKARIEAKTVYRSDLELIVNKDKIQQADYFVLCQTDNQLAMTEIVGYIDRARLKEFGERYPGDSNIRLNPAYLDTFQPIHISPEQIRDAQVNSRTSR